MQTRLIFYIIALCSILLQYGCSDVEVVNKNEPLLPDIAVEQLLGYPDTIYIEGRQVYLSTYMWRDFMPISPPDGKPLIAIMSITAVDTIPKLPAFPRMLFGSFIIIRYGRHAFQMNKFLLRFFLIFSKKLPEKDLNRYHVLSVFLL